MLLIKLNVSSISLLTIFYRLAMDSIYHYTMLILGSAVPQK